MLLSQNYSLSRISQSNFHVTATSMAGGGPTKSYFHSLRKERTSFVFNHPFAETFFYCLVSKVWQLRNISTTLEQYSVEIWWKQLSFLTSNCLFSMIFPSRRNFLSRCTLFFPFVIWLCEMDRLLYISGPSGPKKANHAHAEHVI